jgi:hypothetical protein
MVAGSTVKGKVAGAGPPLPLLVAEPPRVIIPGIVVGSAA